MREIRDYYKILGTNREALDYAGMRENRRDDNQIDEFLKEKYEHALKLIKIKREANPQRRAELEEEEKKIAFAYEHVNTPIKRELYHKFLDAEKKKSKRGVEYPRIRTAYDELNTTIKSLEYRTEKQNDMVLERKKDELIRKYRKLIEISTSFSEKQQLELEIQKILQSYELVKTESLRKEYSKELERMQKQQDDKIRKQRNKDKYSHEKDFIEDLIDFRKNKEDEKVRMVARKRNPSPIERKLVRSNGEEISFCETAVIGYKNWEALYTHLYEYKVRRIIEGIEKSDTIYTEISIFDLSTDEITGEKINPEYYDCVVNSLLTEDKIEGAQYNGGYIGSIEKDNNGNYYTTIDEKEYLGQDKENLAAIMILKQIKEREVENKKEGEER